jgi:hypothetical protein
VQPIDRNGTGEIRQRFSRRRLIRRLYNIERPPNYTRKPSYFLIAQRTGTFVPLPTPTRGRRMPARKKRPGGVAVNQPGSTPRQHKRHFVRGRLTSAAFLFGQTSAAHQNDNRPTPYQHTTSAPGGTPYRTSRQISHAYAISTQPAIAKSETHASRESRDLRTQNPRPMFDRLPSILLTENRQPPPPPRQTLHPYPQSP